MAASLLTRLEAELRGLHRVADVSVDLLRRIQGAPKSQLAKCLAGPRGRA
jgi:DNA polymerase-3 subunit epsilon